MLRLYFLTVLVVAVSGGGVSSGVAVTPIEKVVNLLTNMADKGKQEKAREEEQYGKYKSWCSDFDVEKARSIAAFNEEIDQANASIEKNTGKIKKLERNIAELDEDLSYLNGDKKAATHVREDEKSIYNDESRNITESIEALEGAINVLKTERGDDPSFTQIADLLKVIPNTKRQKLNAFLQQKSGQEPSAAYENQSGGVINLLRDLLTKFTEEKHSLNQEEQGRDHAYQNLMKDLDARRGTAVEDRALKMTDKAERRETVAKSTMERDNATSLLEADAKSKSDTAAVCEQKSSDFAHRSKLRGEEIVAIEQAVKILSSDEVSGAGKTHLPQMFLQLRAGHRRALSPHQSAVKVLNYLHSRADILGSSKLSMLAVRAATSADPFVKVRQMIEKLLARLKSEGAAEADHKEQCDKDLSKNELNRTNLTSKVVKLHTRYKKHDANYERLDAEIKTLTDEVATLTSQVAKATEIRFAQKEENKATIADAKAAQAAVKKAISVLNNFYEQAGTATALVQQPEIFDTAYQGMQGEHGGVQGLLAVISSDFARLESETESEESSAARSHASFVKDSQASMKEKKLAIEDAEFAKQDADQARENTKTEMEETQVSLNAALDTYSGLKPICITVAVDYDERVQKRQEEIDSLKEALTILDEVDGDEN